MPTVPELSIIRLQQAIDTLKAAYRLSEDGGFPGAVGNTDPAGVFLEASRNLYALVQAVHGETAFQETLDRR